MAASAGRPGQQQLIIRMPDEMHDQLKERSAEDERTMAQTVRLLVRQYLATKETK